MLGALYSLLASATFGLNQATLRRGVITGTVTQAIVVSMPIGLVAFAVIAAALSQLGEIGQFSRWELVMLVLAGVVHMVFGRYCVYRSIQAMGANLSVLVQQWSLLVALALAIAVLHESLDLMKLLGIGLLVLGPAMVAGTQKAGARTIMPAGQVQPESANTGDAPAKFKPRLAEGYLFGVLSCLAFGLSPVLMRAGLERTGLALAGGVVSYGAATVVVALILLLPVARRDATFIDGRNVIWFVWTGLAVAISQIFLYLAMAIAPVTVVQPIMRFQTVFSVLFSGLLNREHEIFDSGVLAAIGISLLGALLLTVDAGTVMRWLDAPPWLATAFAWRWPDL